MKKDSEKKEERKKRTKKGKRKGKKEGGWEGRRKKQGQNQFIIKGYFKASGGLSSSNLYCQEET